MRRPHPLHRLAHLDWGFVVTIVALILVGIAFILSASIRAEDVTITDLTQRQMLWASAGVVLLVGLAIADYRKVCDASWAAYLAGIVLLVLVLFVGRRIHGAVRWLNLFGIQIQPSEFVKLGAILALAKYLASPGRSLQSARTIFGALLIIAIPFLLVARQPDLDTAMAFVPVCFAMMFVAGVPLRYLLGLVALGALAAIPGWFLMSPYQHERILVFFDPGRDPLGSGWNSIQSGIAVGSGGLTGKGYMMGTQNILGFLPRTVAPTDFIFSVIAEETGFVGSVVLLCLFAALLTGCLRAAMASRDKLGRLLCTGVATMLFFHVFLNMGMTVGLMPIAGLPLPLVSYGGSFMMCTMMSLGIVQSVYVRRIRR